MDCRGLPRSALGPSEANNEVSIHTLIPVHGILAIVQVVAECAKITIVILDIVDAARATSHETRLQPQRPPRGAQARRQERLWLLRP